MTRRLQVRVKPSARISALSRHDAGSWLAQLRAAPVDGKANAELIGLVAAHFGIARRDVTIRRGAAARIKLLELKD